MRYLLNLVLVVGIALSALVFVGDSHAQTIDISTWATAGTFSIQDKIYTYVSRTGDLQAVDNAAFSFFTASGVDYHSLQLTRDAPDIFTTNFSLRYSIEIDLGLQPLRELTSVQLSIDRPVAGVSAVMTIYSDAFSTQLIGPITVSDGASGYFALPTGYTKVWVEDIVTFSGGVINSLTNTTTEADRAASDVPEPTSLAIWSVLAGVGGLVSWRRRRKQRLLTGTAT